MGDTSEINDGSWDKIYNTKHKRQKATKIIQKDREVKKREDKRRTFYQKSCCWILTEMTITWNKWAEVAEITIKHTEETGDDDHWNLTQFT